MAIASLSYLRSVGIAARIYADGLAWHSHWRAKMKWLDPTLDIVFRMLFGDERNRPSLVALLEAVLQPEEPIVDVVVLNPELPKATPLDKGTILDVRVRFLSGRYAHIEMQRLRPLWRAERGLFYWARMFTTQLSRGEEYDALEPVIGIFILDFVEFEDRDVHSTFQILETRRLDRLTDALELHFIELPKVAGVPPRAGEPKVLRWARFFSAKNHHELEQAAMNDPDLLAAKEALERLALDPVAQRLAEEREWELNHYASVLRKEAAKGRAAGHAAGHAAGRTEGARAALMDAIERCTAHVGVEIDAERRAYLEAATEDELTRLLDTLFVERTWPGDPGSVD
jgi:predicted transposase/invertase (TIGR01784 family)